MSRRTAEPRVAGSPLRSRRGSRRGRGPGRLLAGALAAALLAAVCAGCAQSMDPIERLGKKAAQKAAQRAHPASGVSGPEHSGNRRRPGPASSPAATEAAAP
ncbi:hypothetical protein OK074_8331, partial [Actinobacteria bacterium OK074]